MIRYLLILSLFLSGLQLHGQVQFKSLVARTEVRVGQKFEVQFSINREGEGFSAPSFQGFKVLRGPITARNSYRDNTTRQVKISYTYVLQAVKEGEYLIGPAFIKVDDRTYKTEALEMRVIEARSSSPSRRSPLAFAKAKYSKSSVYIGEPFIAAYRLYYRRGLAIGQQNVSEEPKFEGFYKEYVQRNRIVEEVEYFDNLAYNAGNLREIVLIPQKLGDFNAGSIQINMPARVNTGRRDYYNRPLSTTKILELPASFPTIKVKPLPSKGRPQNFSGAVGKFKLSAEISDTEVNTDGSLNLRIRIEGRGNIKLVDLPKVEFPKAFEVFDPEIKESNSTSSSGMSGYKQINYLLVPRYKGSYTIEPITFSYFDPDREKYVRLESEAFEIKVDGQGSSMPYAQGQAADPIANANPEEVEFLNKDILFIKTKAQKWHQRADDFLHSGGFFGLIGLLLSLAGLAIFLWFRLRNEYANRDSLRVQRAGKLARKKLQKAEKALRAGAAETFYQELELAILGFFQDKLGKGLSSLSKEALREHMIEAECRTEDIDLVMELLAKSEMARFTGLKIDAAEQDFENAQQVLTEIEKQL